MTPTAIRHTVRLAAAACCALALLAQTPSAAWSAQKSYTRTTERYNAPEVTLIDQNGKRVPLKTIADSNRPVIVQFIFATCTTICPVLSAGFANLQGRLGSASENVHLISISIDPENDTPKIMRDYLKRYRAKPGWDFYTGSRRDIDAVMKAFDAYIPNKMSHYALTLIRTPGSDRWTRIYGIMSSSEFLDEVGKAGIK